MCQPRSWVVTIFATISSMDLYFASIVCTLRLAISHTEIFAFVDCVSLLSQRYTRWFCTIFACQIWTQAQIANKFHRCLLLTHKTKVIAVELLVNLIADIWHGSHFRHCFPLLEDFFFHILVQQTGRWITRLVLIYKYPPLCSLTRPVQRLFRHHFSFSLFLLFHLSADSVYRLLNDSW